MCGYGYSVLVLAFYVSKHLQSNIIKHKQHIIML